MNNKTQLNIKANKILKKIFENKNIYSCELRLDEDCQGIFALTFAHRKKRRYYKTVEELSNFNEVVLACVNCHMKIEKNKELTEEVFRRLRDNE